MSRVPRFFQSVAIDDGNFNSSTVGTLSLVNVTWPSSRDKLLLGGMEFQYSDVGAGAWRSLYVMADSAAYPSIYATLEAFLQRQGYVDEAKDVYLRRKRRERDEVLSGFAWASSLFLDLSIEFGRSPQRMVVAGLLVVAIGALVFRRRVMEAVDADAGPGGGPPKIISYNPVWYSLDAFVPGVDLQCAKYWMPIRTRDGIWMWLRVHVALGWLLVPISLVAISGVLK